MGSGFSRKKKQTNETKTVSDVPKENAGPSSNADHQQVSAPKAAAAAEAKTDTEAKTEASTKTGAEAKNGSGGSKKVDVEEDTVEKLDFQQKEYKKPITIIHFNVSPDSGMICSFIAWLN